ncbi:glycosyltransferase family 2 protein [Candidatus Gottesmanbacteria bacterium]|nr:glycosyltransferase family 2 protein [Candidatus Gottesmanbacteria bacterium]
MNNGFSIAIVTRRRPLLLARCLQSIEQLNHKPDIVLIIDNDDLAQSKPAVQQFSNRLPLIYITEPRQGVAFARNCALRQVTTPLLGFVDDDCILDTNWLTGGLQSMQRLNISYVIGRSLLFNQKSVLAQAKYIHQTYWFFQKLQAAAMKPTPFNFDTKNILLRVADFKKTHVRFDPTFTIETVDSSDTDMGFQIAAAGLSGIYNKNLIVTHEEVDQLAPFLLKAFARGRMAYRLSEKWHTHNEFVDEGHESWIQYFKSVRYWRHEFHQYMKKMSFSMSRKLNTFLFIKLYERIYLSGYFYEKKLP